MTVPRRVGLAPMQSVSDELTFYALDFTEPFTASDLSEVAFPSEVNRWLRRMVASGDLVRRWTGKVYEHTWRND